MAPTDVLGAALSHSDLSRWLQPDQSRFQPPHERKYSADQPRVPAGNPDGGQWASGEAGGGINDPRVISDATPDDIKPGAQYAQNRSGRGTGGQPGEPTPGQAARLAIAEARAQDAIRQVQQLDPNWKPTPSLRNTPEGEIATAEAEAREAEAKLQELATRGIGPGPFSGDSIAAREGRRLTEEERNELNRIGSQSGCHTCGTFDPGTRLGNWFGDHQYPTALNPVGRPQRLFPQCIGCSRAQGGWVNLFKFGRF